MRGLRRVVHVEIQTGEVDRSVDFYRDVFGWKPTVIPGSGTPYVHLAAGNPEERGINASVAGIGGTAPRVVPTIEVESIEAFSLKVAEAGGSLVSGIIELEGTGRFMYFDDPDGIRFGMIEYSSK